MKNKEIANTFNEYFGSIVESLDLHIWTEGSSNVPPSYTNDGAIDNLLIKFFDHPTIKKIKQNFNIASKFSFEPVSTNASYLEDLKSNKSVGRDIQTNILKECNFTFSVLADDIENDTFPDCLKEASVTKVFKKDDPLDKGNYRPVSILPLFSKVFEKLIYNQISNYIYREFFEFIHTLFKLLHSWEKELDQQGFAGTILMDL